MDRRIAMSVAACILATDAPRTPRAALNAPVTLDEAIAQRRSVRTFTGTPPSNDAIGRLCWAAQGITDTTTGHRAAPSAGALYPLELYVVGRAGVFHYEPRLNALPRTTSEDRRDALARASLGQDAVRQASVSFVITAVVARTRAKYGDRAERYAYLEAGHAAQNLLLEATSLHLGAVPIGAFDDDAVRRVLGASMEETPLYVIPVGSR